MLARVPPFQVVRSFHFSPLTFNSNSNLMAGTVAVANGSLAVR